MSSLARPLTVRFVPAALLLIASTGCALLPGGANDPFGGALDRPAQLVVTNRNFNDATIWAVYSADRHRLGVVTGHTESRLTLPSRNIAEPVYLEIYLLGGDFCLTDQLMVDPGDVLELDIHPQPSSLPECRRRGGA